MIFLQFILSPIGPGVIGLPLGPCGHARFPQHVHLVDSNLRPLLSINDCCTIGLTNCLDTWWCYPIIFRALYLWIPPSCHHFKCPPLLKMHHQLGLWLDGGGDVVIFTYFGVSHTLEDYPMVLYCWHSMHIGILVHFSNQFFSFSL